MIAVVTKTDLVVARPLAEQLMAVQRFGEEAGLSSPRSCRSRRCAGDQVDLLAELLTRTLPDGPALYPDGELTDSPELIMVAELIREAALEGVRDELPHSLAVVVEEMMPREGRPADTTDRRPRQVYVERDSQKGIIIGHQGARLREVGTVAAHADRGAARHPIYLDLHVRVAKDWQRDPKQLRKLGF